MKKIVINQTGGPEVLQVIECPDPEVAGNEVLINLESAGLNWSEVMIRRGEWPMDLSGGFTPGVEGAGIVEAVGEEVGTVKPGDRVANFDLSAYSETGQGNYAEKIAVHEDKILKLPGNINLAEAAALPTAILTAYDAMINHSPLPESGTVLITACTGAVGIAAMQVARIKGLRVIGTTRSPEKKTDIENLGAEPVVEADPDKLVGKILSLTGGEGVDYIFDPVNGETATRLLPLIKENGTFVCYGLLSGSRFSLDASLMFKQIKVHGYLILNNLADTQVLQKTWKEILPLLEDNAISIPAAKTFPLQEAAQAHKEFERHAHFGKLLLVK